MTSNKWYAAVRHHSLGPVNYFMIFRLKADRTAYLRHQPDFVPVRAVAWDTALAEDYIGRSQMGDWDMYAYDLVWRTFSTTLKAKTRPGDPPPRPGKSRLNGVIPVLWRVAAPPTAGD